MIPVHVFTLDGLLVWGYYPDEFGLLTHEIMRLVEAEIIGGSSSNVLTWIRRSNVVREQKVVAGRMKDILNSPHNFENGWFKFLDRIYAGIPNDMPEGHHGWEFTKSTSAQWSQANVPFSAGTFL